MDNSFNPATDAIPVGNDPNFDSVVASIESNNNPNAQAPTSSAKGLYQFTDSTADQYGLQDPTDPLAATGAFHQLTNDNRAFLSKALGREPTDPELYLAHQQGAAGAAKMILNPDVPAVNIVGKAAVIHNGGNVNMTAGDFANLWQQKYNTKAQHILGQSDSDFNPSLDATPVNPSDSSFNPATDSTPITDPGTVTSVLQGAGKGAYGLQTAFNGVEAVGQDLAAGAANALGYGKKGVTDKSLGQYFDQNQQQTQQANDASETYHPIANAAGQAAGAVAQGAMLGAMPVGEAGNIGKTLGVQGISQTAASPETFGVLGKLAQYSGAGNNVVHLANLADTAGGAYGVYQGIKEGNPVDAILGIGELGLGAKAAARYALPAAAKVGQAAIALGAGANIVNKGYQLKNDIVNNSKNTNSTPENANTPIQNNDDEYTKELNQGKQSMNTPRQVPVISPSNVQAVAQQMGPEYGPMLMNAASKGSGDLAALHYALSTTDPKYNELYQSLNDDNYGDLLNPHPSSSSLT